MMKPCIAVCKRACIGNIQNHVVVRQYIDRRVLARARAGQEHGSDEDLLFCPPYQPVYYFAFLTGVLHPTSSRAGGASSFTPCPLSADRNAASITRTFSRTSSGSTASG